MKITEGFYDIIPQRKAYDVLGAFPMRYWDIEFDAEPEPAPEPEYTRLTCKRCDRPFRIKTRVLRRMKRCEHCYRCKTYLEVRATPLQPVEDAMLDSAEARIEARMNATRKEGN